MNDIEKSWIDSYIEKFLLEIEKTSMSKSYKIPVLKSFIGNKKLIEKVSLEKIGEEFMKYYKNNKIHQKDLNNKKHKGWENWDIERFKKEAKNNPIKFLNKTEYFYYDEINKEFRLSDDVIKKNSEILKNHFADIVKFKSINYFARRY